VYAFLRGSGIVLVDNAEGPVQPGMFIALDRERTRQVRAGPHGLTYIAVCR